MQNDLYELAQRAGRVLSRQKMRLVTAESCTGGWIAKVITDVTGSSEWFYGGFVTYSNDMKQQHLSIDREDLRRHGAVSQPVVEAMAEAALVKSDANVSVAVSGIAGPDGGSPEKPVGTVWFAWALDQPQTIRSKCEMLPGDRMQIRYAAAGLALQGIIQLLGGEK